jgi:fused signal recognition particle receptor
VLIHPVCTLCCALCSAGLILTKLDGTARGGAVVSVVDQLKLPVKFIGVGETPEDLQPFDAVNFAEALFPASQKQ